MAASNNKNLAHERAVAKALCLLLPTKKYRVIFRFSRRLKDEGSCAHPKNGKMVITIRENARDIIDTIIHEYAHALDADGRGGFYTDPHGESWGRYYAKVYRAFERLNKHHRVLKTLY